MMPSLNIQLSARIRDFIGIVLIVLICGFAFGQTWQKNFRTIAQTATPVTIEQQVNIIDQEFYTSLQNQPGDKSLGAISFDPALYDGPTVYLEAITKCQQCLGGDAQSIISLLDGEGNTVASIDTQQQNYTLVRSQPLNLSAGDFTISVSRDANSGTAYVRAARLIIVQSASGRINQTVSQIEMGDSETFTNQTGQERIVTESGTVDLPAAAAVETISLDHFFNRDHSFVICRDQNAPSSYLTTCELIDSSTIRLSKYQTAAPITLEYVVVEDDLVEVQSGTFVFASNDDPENEQNLAVAVNTDLTRAIRSARCSLSLDQEQNCGLAGIDITADGSKIRIVNENTDSVSVVYAWSLVEFADSNAIGPYNLQDSDTVFALGDEGQIDNSAWQFLPHPKIYLFEQDNFTSNSLTAYINATLKSEANKSIQARLYNLTRDEPVDNSTIDVKSEVWELGRSQMIPIGTGSGSLQSGDEYSLQIKGKGDMANAKLVLVQDSGGLGLTKTETIHQYNNTYITHRTSEFQSQGQANQANKEHFTGGRFLAYFESILKTDLENGAGMARVNVPAGEVGVSGNKYSRQRSENIFNKLPNKSVVDVQLQSPGQINVFSASSWLIIHADLSVATPESVAKFTMNNYRWFVDDGQVDPADAWGQPDLPENTQIGLFPATADPPSANQPLRLRLNVLVNQANADPAGDQFKLQFKKGTDSNCITGTWTDVEPGAVWDFAESGINHGEVIQPILSTSDVGENYVKNKQFLLNHPADIGEEMEFDFHLIGSNVSDATPYSFRVVMVDGSPLDSYMNCPTLTTEPNTSTLLRHGSFFLEGEEQGFFWAD